MISETAKIVRKKKLTEDDVWRYFWLKAAPIIEEYWFAVLDQCHGNYIGGLPLSDDCLRSAIGVIDKMCDYLKNDTFFMAAKRTHLSIFGIILKNHRNNTNNNETKGSR